MNPVRAAKLLAVPALIAVAGGAAAWWMLAGPGSDSDANDVLYGEGGAYEPVLTSAEEAVATAEQRVGFDVRVPKDVPKGFTLRSVAVHIGPLDTDHNGIVVHDLSYDRTVTLAYGDGKDRLLAVEQMAPERGLQGFREARPSDPGLPEVKATILERPGVTHLIWDSLEATYRFTLASRDGTVAPDGEAQLLAMASSMR